MNDDALERELRAWYRAEIDDTLVAPDTLREGVHAIPTLRVLDRRLGSSRRGGFLLLAAAIGTTAVVGSAVVGSRLLQPTPLAPDPSLMAVLPNAVAPSTVLPTSTNEATVSPSAKPDRGWLVFSSNGRLNVARGDGSDRRQLTDGAVDDYFPMWSPDGRQIAFVSQACVASERCPDKGVGSQLVVINADGSNRRVLRSGLENPSDPRWLADGSGIVESSWDPNGGHTERIGLDGSVRADDEEIPMTWPSPDGSEVIGIDDEAIRISNRDGTNSRVLVGPSIPGGRVSIIGWSPDGQSIAYDDIAPGILHRATTWRVRRDGSAARPWTELPGGGRLRGWSADGRWMLVAAKTEAATDYIIAAADGSRPRVLDRAILVNGWTRSEALLIGEGEPDLNRGLAGHIVMVDPAKPDDPVRIEAPGLLGYDWRAGD
jgi:dipeptidyl aminopeptidase/acylaminoacyl peptidase